MKDKRIIPLTYSFHPEMFKYPKDPAPEITKKEASTQERIEGAWSEGDNNPIGETTITVYSSGYTELRVRSHHGTHIDAPAHKIPGGKTIDGYDISKFINCATLIDLTHKGILKKRWIGLEDIKKEVDRSEGLRALVFYTGFCDEMSEREGKLEGEAKKEFEKTFPYFTEEAAKYIADNYKGLNIVGIDSFAVDPSGSNSEAHRAFFTKDILPLETLVNLRELRNIQDKSFELNCVPLPYSGADAAQTVAYARIN